MNKNLLITAGILLLALLFFQGCQKTIQDEPVTTSENELESRDHHGKDESECRLISNISEFGEETFKYNRRGLLDEWYVSFYDGYFKQEYDLRERLIKSRLYSGGALVNTIVFFYHNDRVVKETWYKGDTKEKTDEVFHHYNSRGLVKKTESFIGDYSYDHQYSPEGNLLSLIVSFGDGSFYTVEYTYLRRQKNPFSAIPGLDKYNSLAGAFYLNKWYSTSQKVIFYDEAGNSTILSDQDPSKTIVQTNERNCVTASDFFEVPTQEYIHFRFEYENCSSDDKHKTEPAQKLSPVGNRKINPLKFLRPGSAKSLKEQVKELRKQMKK